MSKGPTGGNSGPSDGKPITDVEDMPEVFKGLSKPGSHS
jgi:hypothetical protein